VLADAYKAAVPRRVNVMMKKLALLIVAAGAVALVATGCKDECKDRFDCGDNQICVNGDCVPAPPPGTDAGPDPLPDAGTVDAGFEDAGTEDAGVVDAGPDCTPTNRTCTGPYWCELPGDGTDGTCRGLLVGVVQLLDLGAGPNLSQATLVQFDDPGRRITLGTAPEVTREPRFSADGERVAYVWEPGIGGTEAPQVRQHLLLDGSEDVLANATDAGVVTFTQLEYAPSTNVVWTMVGPMNSRAGVQLVPGAGGAIRRISTGGGYPDPAADNDRIVFDDGVLKIYSLTAGTTNNLTADPNDTLPQFSPNASLVLYARPGAPGDAQFEPLSDEAWISPTAGGTPQQVEAHLPATGTSVDGGTVGSFVTFPTWAASNTRVVFVRVTYFFNADGDPQICEPTDPVCNGLQGQQIVFREVDATGAPVGDAVIFGNGIHPSVSPDGTQLAFISRDPLTGGSLLKVEPIGPDGTALGGGTTHVFPRLETVGDDSRPRWQPKQ
jgi:hypothetical protein